MLGAFDFDFRPTWSTLALPYQQDFTGNNGNVWPAEWTTAAAAGVGGGGTTTPAPVGSPAYSYVALTPASTNNVTATNASGVQVGDYLLLTVKSQTSGSNPMVPATPTGWTLIGSASAGQGIYIYGKFAVSADTTATGYTVTLTGGTAGDSDSFESAVLRFTGVNTTTPIDVAAATVSTGYVGTTTTQTMTLPSVTTVTANTLQVALVSLDDVSTTPTMPVPSGFTADETAPHLCWRLAHQARPTAGATGTSTWSWTAAYAGADMKGINFALRGAVSTATPASVDIQNNTGRLVTAQGVGANAASVNATLTALAAAADFDVTFDVAVPDATVDCYPSLWLRTASAAASAKPTNAYYLTLDPTLGTSYLSVGKYVGGVATNLSGALADASGTAMSNNTTKRLRIAVVGTQLSVKAWNPAAAEPGTWTWQGTDTSVTGTGLLALGLLTGSTGAVATAYFDNVTVNTPVTVTLGTLAATGTGSATLSGFDASSSGTLTAAGSGSASLTGADTIQPPLALAPAGTGSATLTAGALLISGTLTGTGTGSVAFGTVSIGTPVSGTGVGTSTLTGTFVTTNATVASAGVGSSTLTGSLGKSGTLSGTGTGTQVLTGSVTESGALTGTGTGSAVLSGRITIQPTVTATGTGTAALAAGPLVLPGVLAATGVAASSLTAAPFTIAVTLAASGTGSSVVISPTESLRDQFHTLDLGTWSVYDQSLVDTFDTADTTKWTFGPGTTVTGGRLAIPATPAYPTVTSKATFDATKMAAVVQLVQTAGRGNGGIDSQIYFGPDINNALSFTVEGDLLYCQYSIGGSFSTVAVPPYDPVAHAWWRIRVTGGTAYWETSPDGTTWTAVTTWTVSGLNLTASRLFLQAGYWDTEPSPGTALFDNVSVTYGGSGVPDVSVSGDQLVLQGQSYYPSITSLRRYDLTKSYVQIDVPSLPDVSYQTGELQLQAVDANGNTATFLTTNTVTPYTAARRYVVGSGSTDLFTANLPAFRFFRLRENSGTTYWDTSVDGISWSSFYSTPNFIDPSSVTITITAGHWNAAYPTPVYRVESINALVVPGTLAGTGTGSASLSGTGATTATVTAAGTGSSAITPAIIRTGTLAAAGTSASVLAGFVTKLAVLAATGAGTATLTSGPSTIGATVAASGSGSAVLGGPVTTTGTVTAAGSGSAVLASAIIRVGTLVPAGTGTASLTGVGATTATVAALATGGSAITAASASGSVAATGTGSASLTGLATHQSTLAGAGVGSAVVSNIGQSFGSLAATGTGTGSLTGRSTITALLAASGVGIMVMPFDYVQAAADTAAGTDTVTATWATPGSPTPATLRSSTVQGTEAQVSSPAGANNTITKPAGTVAGDLLIAAVGGDGTPVTPSGWTQIGTTVSNNGKLAVYYKVAGASEPTSYVFTETGTTTDTIHVHLFCVTGGSTTPTAVLGGGTATTSLVEPSVTVAASNSLVIGVVMIDGGTNTITQPSGMTQIASTTQDSWMVIESAQQSYTATGATGTKTATATTSRAYNSATILIGPGGSAGSTFNASPGQDALGLTDAETNALNAVRLPADTQALSDAVSVVRTVVTTVADTEPATDAVAKGRVLAPITDTVGLTDVGGKWMQPVVADSLGLTDAEAIYGVFAIPVVTTAEPDVTAKVSLNDVASLSGTAAVEVNAPADLKKGPQRAVIDIEAGTSDLTHVVALSGTASVDTSVIRPRLRVVGRMTDVTERQLTGVVQTLVLRNGPIYADATLGPASTGGIETGVFGPTSKPVWKLARNLTVPAGWGSYLAADVFDDVSAGATVTISMYVRGPVGEDTALHITDDPSTDTVLDPPALLPVFDGTWKHYTATFVLPKTWVAGVHRLRMIVRNWVEWSDATLTVSAPLQMRGPEMEPEPEPVTDQPKKFNRVFAVLR